MPVRLYEHDDFEAVIRILTAKEKGRRTPAFNGIRWDFAYADDPPPEPLYMIWPDFLTPEGNSRPTNEPLPVGVELPARMLVLAEELREEVHRARITPGVRFYCHEGGQRMAEGVVTRITGLFEPRG